MAHKQPFPKTHPCPICDRPAVGCGLVTIDPDNLQATAGQVADGIVCPVYQCEDCTRSERFGDGTIEVCKTFLVMPDGAMFDPVEEIEKARAALN